MDNPGCILLLEDDVVDAELIRRNLAGTWPDCEVLLTNDETSFQNALQAGGFDLILSDYSLPGFDGLKALALARQDCPHTPFIFISGAIGDDVAVECLKAGATDYVLKDAPARLVPVVRRALQQAEEDQEREAIQARLRESEEHYRDLFDNATDLIQSVAPDGRFLYVNRAWYQTLRYTTEEVAQMNILDVIHPAYREQYRARFQQGSPEDCIGPWETIFLTKFGHNLYVEGNLGPRLVAGKLVSLRGIFRDVTEKKLTEVALQRSIRQHQSLVDSVDGIVWEADFPSLRFTFVSQQAERLLGYPVRCWLEEPQFWQNHIHPDDQEKAINACAGITAMQKHKSFEYRMVSAHGRTVWVRDIVSLRTGNGEPPKLQGIMVDITLRKLAEQKIRRIQDQLKQTNQDLLRKQEEIQSFCHTLSHELKTPLTSAREFICIVMDGLAGEINENQAKFLGIARQSCDQLTVCINDLLDATRLETGKLKLELGPASIRSLIQRVVMTLNSNAVAKQLVIKQHVDPGLPTIPLDQNRIVQVLTNLLSNAISYTPHGGKIVVSAGHPPKRSDQIEICVRDTGCGIPPEEQSRIFDRLYQVRQGDAASERGVGLGLYLCRELVELHGGSIRVQSEPGQGSSFTFVLPIDQPVATPRLKSATEENVASYAGPLN
jgi:PAS domain S-box-containing protein